MPNTLTKAVDTSNLVPYTGGTADITITHDIRIDSDSKKLFLGASKDASIHYSGGFLVLTSDAVGSGAVECTNGIILTGGRYVPSGRVGLTSGDTTPSVQAGNIFICAGGRGAGTTITDFDNALDGQIISICADDSALTISNNPNIQLQGSVNFAMSTGDTLTLCYAISSTTFKWSELSRMTV